MLQANQKVFGFTGYLLFFSLGTLLAFDDVKLLALVGGQYASSPGYFLLIPALAYLFSRNPAKSGYVKRIGLTSIITLALSFYVFLFGPNEAFGQSVISKIFKNYTQVAAFLGFVVLGLKIAKDESCKKITLSIGLGMSLFTIVGIIADLSGFDFFDSLHYATNYQQRLRGFRFEASSLASAVLMCLCFLIIYSHRKYVSIFALLILLLMINTIPSLGFYFVAIAVTVVFLVRIMFRRPGPWFEGMFVLFLYIGLVLVTETRLWSFRDLTISDTTRVFWLLLPLFSMIQFPFGIGFGNHLWVVPELANERVIPWMQQNLSFGNYSEIYGFLNQISDTSLYPKNLPSTAILHLGIFGLVLFLFLVRLVFRNALFKLSEGNHGFYLSSLIVSFTSVSFFGALNSWDIAILLGILFSIKIRNSPYSQVD
jgi:hypothetical protein